MSQNRLNRESLPDSTVFAYRYTRLADTNKYQETTSCLDLYEKPRSSYDILQAQGRLVENSPVASSQFIRSWKET